MFERILSEGQVTENDQYSQDPARKKLYWLQSASTELDRYLGALRRDLGVFPQNSSALLQTGESGQNIVFLTRVLGAIPPVDRKLASSLVDEMHAIAREKGFRFGPALMTSREHKECGSSGYGGIYWDTDPDMPIPLLRQRLLNEGKLDPSQMDEDDPTYTVDEIDRARRLTGMTRLDLATARVTSEIDQAAAADSYYFLAPERRKDVIKREQEILASVEDIANTATAEHEASGRFLLTMASFTEGALTTPQLMETYRAILERTEDAYQLSLSAQIRELRQLAFQAGKFDSILTPQEILVREGGSAYPKYLARPYTPLAVQDGMSVRAIDFRRQQEQSMVVNTCLLEYTMPFGFRLEELDEKGNTVKSPALLNHQDGETSIETDDFKEYFGPQMNFPFARPEDWFKEVSLPIIGTDKFAVTEQGILDAIAEIQDGIANIKRTSEDPNQNERIKTKVLSFLPRFERNLAVLTCASSSQVLSEVRAIYDDTRALARSGMTELEIAAKIYEKYPKIIDYNDLLESKTAWGYHLIQTVIGYKKFGAQLQKSK